MNDKILSLINRRRRQILVHSYIYYELDTNIIDDSTWSKCNRDDPICIGFKFKNDYPIEELGSLEEMLSESMENCLNKKPMIPRKKTLEERIGKLEKKVQKLEKTNQ